MQDLRELGLTGGLASVDRRLKAVLDNASVSIFLMNDRQQCIYMNRAAELLTGYTLAEILKLDCPLHDIIHHTHPDGRPFPLHECAIDRAFPEHNQMRGEEVFVHRNGSFYPVAFCASPIRDDASKTIGTIIEVQDITLEKRAKEHQRLLVNELNHRVKNTLATVQALARQTFNAVAPEALARFTSRLTALSKAHDVLTGNSWEAALLNDIVHTAITPFGPERFVLDGGAIALSPKMAVTLSMALHELATNAAKYGSLSCPGGQVAVRWSITPQGKATRLEIVWEESGGPEVHPPTRTGFGTRLIERQLAYEFGGRTELEFRPSGLVCRMDFTIPGSGQTGAGPVAAAGAA